MAEGLNISIVKQRWSILTSTRRLIHQFGRCDLSQKHETTLLYRYPLASLFVVGRSRYLFIHVLKDLLEYLKTEAKVTIS